MQRVTPLKVAFKTTVTGAREDHICTEKATQNGCVLRAVRWQSQVWVMHSGQVEKTEKEPEVQFSRLRLLACCVFVFVLFKYQLKALAEMNRWTLQSWQRYILFSGLLFLALTLFWCSWYCVRSVSPWFSRFCIAVDRKFSVRLTLFANHLKFMPLYSTEGVFTVQHNTDMDRKPCWEDKT